MFNLIRSFVTSRLGAGIAIGLLILIALSFASGDISNVNSFGGGGGGDRVASVGDENVSTSTLSQAMTSALDRVKQQDPTMSMKAFIADIDGYLSESSCLSHAWMGLLRDYIIAQHTITALEKWRDREANTFHFSYQNGRFGYIHSGETGYSASRFRQAFDMLVDLGLVESQLQPGRSRLTPLGQSTLERVRKAPSDPNATD